MGRIIVGAIERAELSVQRVDGDRSKNIRQLSQRRRKFSVIHPGQTYSYLQPNNRCYNAVDMLQCHGHIAMQWVHRSANVGVSNVCGYGAVNIVID